MDNGLKVSAPLVAPTAMVTAHKTELPHSAETPFLTIRGGSGPMSRGTKAPTLGKYVTNFCDFFTKTKNQKPRTVGFCAFLCDHKMVFGIDSYVVTIW